MGHQSYVLLCIKITSFPPSEGRFSEKLGIFSKKGLKVCQTKDFCFKQIFCKSKKIWATFQALFISLKRQITYFWNILVDCSNSNRIVMLIFRLRIMVYGCQMKPNIWSNMKTSYMLFFVAFLENKNFMTIIGTTEFLLDFWPCFSFAFQFVFSYWQKSGQV